MNYNVRAGVREWSQRQAQQKMHRACRDKPLNVATLSLAP